MNNEIKLIERILATSKKYITYAERCYVLDIITNLQAENEKVHKELDYADNYNIYLISKIDKAIEYIPKLRRSTSYELDEKLDDLLNILNGGDENDN